MERDAFMQPVPKHLAAIFASRRELLEGCAESYQVESRILHTLKTSDTACQGVDARAIRRLFQTIREHLANNMPAYVCRRCRKLETANCHCGGKGWLTEGEAQQPEVIVRLLGSKES